MPAPGHLCLLLKRWIVAMAAICLVAGLHAHAQERPAPPARPNPFPVERTGTRPQPVPQPAPVVPARFQEDIIPPTPLTTSSSFTDPATVGTSLKVLVAVTVLGLVPSILLMTTCFVRFTVVLGMLRQAMGTPQALPNQILTALGMFMTFLVMAPVWQRSYDEGIRPYTNPTSGSQPVDEALAFQRSAAPLRDFMARQIDQAGNADAVWMLIDYQRPEPTSPRAATWHEPQNYDDVPLTVLAPAYLLSELKVAFLIGFQIFLPFLVIDLVVSSILTSLGLNMLPPSMISLPFKLLLFVLIDGWFLTVGMLLESVRLA
ncbi:MAG: flagellar type III secretion system pore protein FliP [Planctomycetes bacterium]|nr:flagellar type III secretion system pore protein FliP [Planctomycetota bacterium]